MEIASGRSVIRQEVHQVANTRNHPPPRVQPAPELTVSVHRVNESRKGALSVYADAEMVLFPYMCTLFNNDEDPRTRKVAEDYGAPMPC